MNVWIVNHYAIPPSMGGLVRHYYFSKCLQEKGHKVKIFTSSKIHNSNINMIKGKDLFDEQNIDGIEYTFVRGKDYSGNGIDRICDMMEFPFRIWKTLKKFYLKERPDVIYTSSPDLFVALTAVVFGRRFKLPVVVEIRDLWPESIVEYKGFSPNNPIIKILYQIEKWIYIKADKLIFTMEGGKKYIKDKRWDKDIDLNKVFHINNGVDLNEFEHNQMNYIIEDKDLEDPTTFKVIYMGSIRFVNHLEEIVNVARVLKKWGENKIHFYIYGEGTEKDALQTICEKEKLNISFKGKVEKKYIPGILSKADLNVINVRSSGLVKYGCSWNKLFEYMACGKPILSNCPVEYDLIKMYKMGISEKFLNQEEYAKRILYMSHLSREAYNELCENAKAAVKNYDYYKLSEKLEKILKSLAK